MDVSFDPRWDRLPHLFAGELSEDEARALQEWIDALPERRDAVARLREVWQLAAAAREWDADAGLAVIHRRTGGEPGRVIAQVGRPVPRLLPQPSPPHRIRTALAAAAAVVVMAGGVTLWQTRVRPSAAARPSATFAEYRTRAGERLSLRLQDGTLVTLAPGSVLRQPSTYGEHDRTLFLDGEAAFVVTHDGARPFAVRTARAVARDIGTRFVVRAYAADSVTDVVVAEGVVAVGRSRGDRVTSSLPLGRDSVLLTIGDRARVTTGGDLESVHGVALEPYFGWVNGRLSFDKTPLAEAARQLGRWHDVEIRFADAPAAARRLTASFGDEPVADIMHRIAVSLDLEVTRDGRTFLIQSR